LYYGWGAWQDFWMIFWNFPSLSLNALPILSSVFSLSSSR
jgi:hypothetical protein